jgi:ribose 5-phosphate isomerase B
MREKDMRIGIAADHGGFGLKEDLHERLVAAGHEVVDFGSNTVNSRDNYDDYPDFVVPLAKAVAAGRVERGVAICGSGVGASICANKVPGVRADLINDHFSARQGVEDDHMNIICLGGRIIGPMIAWDLVTTFLAADFSREERHLRRLSKVAALENKTASDIRDKAAVVPA